MEAKNKCRSAVILESHWDLLKFFAVASKRSHFSTLTGTRVILLFIYYTHVILRTCTFQYCIMYNTVPLNVVILSIVPTACSNNTVILNISNPYKMKA